MTASELALDPGALSPETAYINVEDAPTVRLDGEEMAFVMSGDGQNPDVIVGVAPPGSGPPLHSHPHATYEVVIEGRIRAVVDGEEYLLGPGDFLYTPPNAPHTFVVEGEAPARIVGMNIPGGSRSFFEDLAAAAAGTDGPPDPAAMAEVAARHGNQLLGPPLNTQG